MAVSAERIEQANGRKYKGIMGKATVEEKRDKAEALKAAKAMHAYNPDPNWTPAKGVVKRDCYAPCLTCAPLPSNPRKEDPFFFTYFAGNHELREEDA